MRIKAYKNKLSLKTLGYVIGDNTRCGSILADIDSVPIDYLLIFHETKRRKTFKVRVYSA